ncbi:ABC transporter permease [Candidatus Saccharibacteria bacterium]|nr:ABC transporter permease [Candidatus Saccharibacteria bacterium]
MREFSMSPLEMFASLWRNRSLVMAMVKREVVGRYRGSFLGLFWSFFNPLFMLAIYTFVFSVVFKARWGAGTGSKTEFALILFIGLIIFNLFAECFNRSYGLILSNVNYVKKVIFPLEILPFVSLGAAIFHAFISLFVWLLAYLIFFGVPHITILYFPLILIPLSFFILGSAWILSALGVYLRDVSQVCGLLTTVLMFLSPIFYPVTAIPESYRIFLYANPLMPAIEQARSIMFFGNNPDWTILFGYWVAMLCVAWIGFVWFQKTRKGFADVL